MVSLSSGLRRLKLFFTAEMTSNISIGTGEPFNEYFFPSYLTNTTEPIVPTESHSPRWLLHRIIENPRARDAVGSIYISEIAYYKNKELAEHEFLVFRIADGHRPLSNYIKVDRHPPEGKEQDRPPSPTDNDATPSEPPTRQPPGSMANFLWHIATNQSFAISSSSPPPQDTRNARNMVQVSSCGTLRSIVNGSVSTRLGLIKVSRDETVKRPTLEDVLLIADLVSGYAYMIWKLVLFSFEDSVRFDGSLERAGRHRLMPWIEWHKKSMRRENIELTERQTFASISADYLSILDAFEKAVAEKKRSVILADEENSRKTREELHRAKEETTRAQEEATHAKEEAARGKEQIIRLTEELARVKQAASTGVIQEGIEMSEVQSHFEDTQA
ncbi:hypothetical protein RhiLY_13252 [Ceratobasidium sp. AG-Ba]|nr:hypothetical protein RhiLY_13252 [Ceratobasidium sp. AG-Ba]